MTEHVSAWLEAFHDGELRGRQLQQVEAHLAHCGQCRAELEELQSLAALLQESPVAGGLTPPERFVAQVGLRLPRRSERSVGERILKGGWQLFPVGILGAWVFFQAVFFVSRVLLVVAQWDQGSDLLAGLLPTLKSDPGLGGALTLSSANLSGLVQLAAHSLIDQGPFAWDMILSLGVPIVIGLLYWSWLASWWACRTRHQV